ncbi:MULTISPECIES: LuxR C-terminal-related transcriptional regulator [Kytococcus]|nr:MULTISPECIES: LuxR C-terminal-related transcriptional regulator [Kytococcus]
MDGETRSEHGTQALDETTSRALRRTARRLAVLGPDRARDRYRCVHHAVRTLTPTDALVIAFFHEDHVVVPFVIEGDRLEGPDVMDSPPGSVTEWVRDHQRSYVFGQDAGALLGEALPFGDAGEPTRDAVCAPILSPAREVRGVLAAHALRPRVFTDQHVRVVEALAVMLGREGHDLTDPRDTELHRAFPELAPDPGDLVDQLHDLTALVGRMRTGLEGLDDLGGAGVAERVREVVGLCELLEARMATLATETPPAPPGPLSPLTPREAEVAELIVSEQLTNAQIAERLVISEKTVKTHVGSVLRKCGQSQRSGIALVLGAPS